MADTFGVAEAKRRFSELIDRVARGERFLVRRHGRPAVALVPPGEADKADLEVEPLGLVALAGALADWDDLEAVTEEIYASRRRARDRSQPDLG